MPPENDRAEGAPSSVRIRYAICVHQIPLEFSAIILASFTQLSGAISDGIKQSYLKVLTASIN